MFQEGLTAVTFNAAFYLEANADLQTAFGNLSGDALDARLLQHFVEFGQFEGRDPNEFFDTSYYLSENGDVLAAIGNPANTSVTSAFQHFVMFGAAEGVVRAPSAPFESFNAETYLAANPDLQAAFASVPAAQLPNVLFQHFVTFGVNEDRPGTGLDEGSQLSSQLEALAAANADVADVLEAAARFVAENDGEERTAAELDAFIAGFGEPQLNAALSAATSAVAADRSDLTNAQNTLEALPTQATLTSALNQARTALLADEDGADLLAARTAANTALARDVAADGSNEAVLTNLRAAVQGLINSGANSANTTVSVDGENAVSLAQLLASLDTILATEGPDGEPIPAAVRQEAIDNAAENFALGTEAPTVDAGGGGTAAARTALNTQLSVADQRANLLDTANQAQQALEDAREASVDADEAEEATAAAVEAFLTAEENIVARQEAVDAVATAQGELADSLAELAALRSFETDFVAAVEARDAIEAAIVEEFGPITVLADGGNVEDPDADDIFLFDTSGDSIDATITGFGGDDSDVIFVGRGFTQVNLAETVVDFEGTAQGNVNALEIFVQQTDAGALLWIESETFDGSTSTGAFGGSQILLAGVDADDVVLDANGFIRLSPEAEALVA